MPRVLPFDATDTPPRRPSIVMDSVDEPEILAVLQDLRVVARDRPLVFAAVVKLARRLARRSVTHRSV